MGCEFFDLLVRLAAIGGSGVCIFAIFWIGHLLRKDQSDPEYHKSLRHFMSISVLIAAISAVSGIANAMIKQDRITELKKTNEDLQVQSQTLKNQVQEANLAAKAINTVLKAKEAKELRYPSPELRPHIELLRKFVYNSLDDKNGQ